MAQCGVASDGAMPPEAPTHALQLVRQMYESTVPMRGLVTCLVTSQLSASNRGAAIPRGPLESEKKLGPCLGLVDSMNLCY